MSESLDLTKPLRDAIAEAEELIANAPFIRTEADRLEGYDYLSGRIRMALQTAFDYDLEQPLFGTRPTSSRDRASTTRTRSTSTPTCAKGSSTSYAVVAAALQTCPFR